MMDIKNCHSKAPLRLGLAGGGTDVSPYSEVFGGHVLNAAISLYTHCQIQLLNTANIQFIASDFDQFLEIPLTSSFNPNGGPLILHRAVYESISRRFLNGYRPSIKVTTYSDAPPGSGVGSSSSLVVAMVKAYSHSFNIALGEYDIAHLAYEIERCDCQLAGGKQDQYAATFGGFNFMEFGAKDHVLVNPLRLNRELINDFESRLLLYYTGRSRESANIIRDQIAATSKSNSDALNAMHSIKQSAARMKEALLRGEISNVLDLLCSSWHDKKRAAAGISNPHIEELAAIAIGAGADGLKISGAGGGGFMMISVRPEMRFSVIRSMESLGGSFFPFNFISEGAQAWTLK